MLKTVALLLVIFGLTAPVQAQNTLAELASSAGVEWLLGDWQYVGDNGETVELSFKAELDNHICIVTYKDPRSQGKGIILLESGSMEPKYYAGDNRGGVTTGTWTAEDKKAILKSKNIDKDGQTRKMGIKFAKVDASSMELSIHDLNDQNELGDEARVTVKLQRKK